MTLTTIQMMFNFISYDLLVLLISTLLFAVYLKFNRDNVLLSKIPSPPTMPLIGNVGLVVDFKNRVDENLMNLFDTYSKKFAKEGLFKLDLVTHKVVCLFSPNTIEPLLTSTSNLRKHAGYDYTRPFMGNGLFNSEGHKWHHDRKLLTPLFHLKNLTSFNIDFNEQSKILVDILKTKGHVEDLLSQILPLTLDIIIKTVFGADLGTQKNFNLKYAQCHQLFATLLWNRAGNPLLTTDFIYNLTRDSRTFRKSVKYLNDFTDEMLNELKQGTINKILVGCKDKSMLRTNLLDILYQAHLSNPTRFTEQDVKDQLNSFLLGGHETSATTVSYVTYFLAKDMDVQKKLQLELDQTFSNKDHDLVASDLSQMVYLDACIKEALRLTPPPSMIARSLDTDLDVGDYVIPKGTGIFVLIRQLHQREESFTDPEKFQPERWLAGNEHMRSDHPFAFMPFSGGPRNCIAQKFAMNELKVILAHIFKNFDVKVTDPNYKLEVIQAATLKPKLPIPVCFIER